jgi:hypothetical protein
LKLETVDDISKLTWALFAASVASTAAAALTAWAWFFEWRVTNTTAPTANTAAATVNGSHSLRRAGDDSTVTGSHASGVTSSITTVPPSALSHFTAQVRPPL